MPYKVTGKVDGTACVIKDSTMCKKRDLKPGRKVPKTWFSLVTVQDTKDNNDEEHLHMIGYMPIEKSDKWHYDCFAKNDDGTLDLTRVHILNRKDNHLIYEVANIRDLEGKSIEVMGPKFQGNPHKLDRHVVMVHGELELKTYPSLDSTNLLELSKKWFVEGECGKFLEGVVVHFGNNTNKMFKVHRHHLDMSWNPDETEPLHNIRIQ